MKICNVIKALEEFAPLPLQHGFDNSGLQVGNADAETNGVLVCIDVDEQVIDEAISYGFNLIVSHHPLIFKGLKSVSGNDYIQRCVYKAIKHDIAIYASHTNLDVAQGGVSHRLGQKLGLTNMRVLVPESDMLSKIVVFVPTEDVDRVRLAAFEAGAGHIGNYDHCSYISDGIGTFRPLSGAEPFVGEVHSDHTEAESRLEMIVPRYAIGRVSEAIRKAHPYEEVALDVIPLINQNQYCGLGVVGELDKPIAEREFLLMTKDILGIPMIKHSAFLGRDIHRVALCGGSGADFIPNARHSGADIYLTGDITHHRFFEADNRLVIADIGHFESEQFAKDIFYDIISKKIPNFAVRLSEVDCNIISYT